MTRHATATVVPVGRAGAAAAATRAPTPASSTSAPPTARPSTSTPASPSSGTCPARRSAGCATRGSPTAASPSPGPSCPPASPADLHYTVHPVLLDACLQALVVSALHLAEGVEDAGSRSYLPAGIGRVRVLADPGRGGVVTGELHAIDEAGEGLSGALRLVADDGTPLLEVTDVYLRRIHRSELPEAPAARRGRRRPGRRRLARRRGAARAEPGGRARPAHGPAAQPGRLGDGPPAGGRRRHGAAVVARRRLADGGAGQERGGARRRRHAAGAAAAAGREPGRPRGVPGDRARHRRRAGARGRAGRRRGTPGRALRRPPGLHRALADHRVGEGARRPAARRQHAAGRRSAADDARFREVLLLVHDRMASQIGAGEEVHGTFDDEAFLAAPTIEQQADLVRHRLEDNHGSPLRVHRRGRAGGAAAVPVPPGGRHDRRVLLAGRAPRPGGAGVRLRAARRRPADRGQGRAVRRADPRDPAGRALPPGRLVVRRRRSRTRPRGTSAASARRCRRCS